MIQLDIRTLSFLAVLIALLMAGAMVLLWWANPNERSARYWALGNIFIGVGFLLIGLRGFIPQLFSVPVANTAIALGYTLLLLGVQSFLNRSLQWRLPVLVALLVFLPFLYFTFVAPNVSSRIVIISVVIAVLSFRAMWLLWTNSTGQMRLIQSLTAVVFLFHGFYLAVRTGATLWQGPIQNLFAGNLVQSLAFLDVIVVSICLTFAFSALINRRLQLQLDCLARYDSLTGTLSRRAFEEATDTELSRARRHGTPFSVLLLDIDHFKKINDRYGHVAGDRLLKAVAETVKIILRKEDVLGRIGGEEFCALLTDADQDAALDISERVRVAVSEHQLEYEGQRLGVTVSIGVATVDGSATNWEDIFHRADMALYEAKHSGRNMVAV